MGAIGLSACGGSDDGFKPPQVGTVLNWKYKTSEGVEDEVHRVVATGPDFAIIETSYDGVKEFSAEFSGVGYTACIYADLPSRSEREALLSAWPLKPGDTFKFNDTDLVAVAPPASALDVMEDTVFWFEEIAEDDSEDDGTSNTYLASSVKYGTVIEIDWQNGDHDWVVSVEQPDTETYDVQEGYKAIVGLDVTKLGECVQLLSEVTPIEAVQD